MIKGQKLGIGLGIYPILVEKDGGFHEFDICRAFINGDSLGISGKIKRRIVVRNLVCVVIYAKFVDFGVFKFGVFKSLSLKLNWNWVFHTYIFFGQVFSLLLLFVIGFL